MKTRRRGMKLLSLILAVMMIVGMIPISAAAAPAAGKVGITLMTGTVSDAILNRGFPTQSKTDGLASAKSTVADAAAELKRVEAAAFTKGTTTGYGPDDTFYVAMDLDTTNLADAYAGATGIMGMQVFFKIPEDTFELVKAKASDPNIVIMNPALTGKVANGDDVGYEDTAGLEDYYGSCTASVDINTTNGKSYIVVTLQISSGNYLIPVKHTGWEVLFPVKVKNTAAPGSKSIEFTTEAVGAGGTEIQYVTNENGQTPTKAGEVTLDKIETAALSLKVTGPSIELKGTPKVLNTTGQKVTVTPGGGLTPASDAEWLICESGQTTGVTATAVAKGDDYELTFDASTLKTDGATEYVVVYKKDTTTLKTEGKFKVLAALTGTAKITGTAKVGETLTAALDGGPAGATLKYQWTAGGKSISGATSSTYTLTAAEAGKTISVVISATGYEGTKTAPATAAVADGDAPSISGVTIDTAEYGADITAAIKAKFTSDASSTFTFSAVNNSILKVDSNKVTVGKGAISGGNNTVNVSIKRPGYAAASTTATLTAKTKKQLTLAASGTAGSGAVYNLPTPTGMVSGDTAPTVTWTKGTETGCTAVLSGTTITATLTDLAIPGTVALTAAITSDDYQLNNTSYTLNVSAAAMTSITLDAPTGFSVSPDAVVQGSTGNTITITPAEDYAIDSVTGTGVTWTSGNTFTLDTTAGQASVTVKITGHAAKTITATVPSKHYDGTNKVEGTITFADKGGNPVNATYTDATFADANVGTGKAVTINGIVWPNDGNTYTYVATGDIQATTPSAATAAATAVSTTAPTADAVKEAIKAAVITFTNEDGKTFTKTVEDLLSGSADLDAAIAAAINNVEAFKGPMEAGPEVKFEASADVAVESALAVNATQNGTIVPENTVAGAASFGFADPAPAGLTIDATTGKIAVAEDADTAAPIAAVVEIKGADGTALATINMAVTVSAGTYGYAIENLAENATGAVDLGNIVSMLDVSGDANITALPATIELSLNVTKSTTPPPGPSGSFKPYMDGYEDGTLLPGRSVTRAQFAKMLVIATGKFDETKTYEKPDYPDVIEGKWYVPYIACAVENKIMDGKEDGKMYPNKTITRQEAAKMIYVALGTTDEIKTTDKVKDFDSVQNWAKMYVATLVEKNIIKGFDDGTFKPKNNITRAQAAVMINRLLGFDPDEAERAKIAELTIEDQFPDVKPSGNWSYAHLMYAAGKLPDSYYAG